jgi:hypothetical protein
MPRDQQTRDSVALLGFYPSCPQRLSRVMRVMRVMRMINIGRERLSLLVQMHMVARIILDQKCYLKQKAKSRNSESNVFIKSTYNFNTYSHLANLELRTVQ